MTKLTTEVIKTKLDELAKLPGNYKKLQEQYDRLGFFELPSELVWKRVAKRKISGGLWVGEVVRLFALVDSENNPEPVCRVVSDPTDTTILRVLFGCAYEPCDFVFAFELKDENNDHGDFVCIGLKSVWDAEKCLSDQSEADDVVPPGFNAVMESVYEYPGTQSEARDQLIAAGFIESEPLRKFLHR